MKYRAEIDGLRALAIIPVIFFHAGVESFSGGFVGVDVFFVISGYLITTILLDEIENNRFSLVGFYERRARRILPVLVFISCLSVIFAWVFFNPFGLNNFGNALIGVATFISNIIFWKSQKYFDNSAELNPLLHTWSLAVEEQYYVLFPIFLFLAWRFGKSKVFWMIVAFTVISLLLSEWGWRNNATANFYLAPTRAWELFFGAIAAFIVQKRGVQGNNTLSLIGLIAIFFSIFTYNESTPFPSIYALVPVFGVVLLILYAGENTFSAKFLSTKILVGIGLISYSAYLWHQPLFAFYRKAQGNVEVELFTSIILILITLSLSFFSWKYIESPFRNRSFLTTKMVFSLSGISLLSLILIGLFSKQASVGAEEDLAFELANNKFVYFSNMDERKFVASRLEGKLNKVDTVLVGSSRVMQVNSDMMLSDAINFSVSGASIKDDIAFLAEAVVKLHPSTVLIGADPWLLNKYYEPNQWKSVSGLYNYWNEIISNGKSDNDKTYFSTHRLDKNNSKYNMAKELYRNININASSNVAINGNVEAIAKKAYDGFHIYNETYVNKEPSLISEGFNTLINYAMKKFEYNNETRGQLEKLISWLKGKDIKVVLILSPYHPQLYLRMVKEKPIFIDIERDFRRIAQVNEIDIVGSYNPVVVGCKKEEFYDGMHPKSSCMKKVISEMHIND